MESKTCSTTTKEREEKNKKQKSADGIEKSVSGVRKVDDRWWRWKKQ